MADLIVRSPHNLVSARATRSEVLSRHVGEARRVGAHLEGLSGRWMDLGTGGGLPGLVLAHQHPGAQWVLVDSSRKKVREVERFASELEVVCSVRAGRAEELAWEPRWRGEFDGVVARAVAPLRSLVELARGFLEGGGRLVAVKGPGLDVELAAAASAMRRTGMKIDGVEAVGEATSVATLTATGPVPRDVPRRTGVPQRRPW